MRTEDYIRLRRKILTRIERDTTRLSDLDSSHEDRIPLHYRRGQKTRTIHRALGRGWKTLGQIRVALLSLGASPAITDASVGAILRRDAQRMGWVTRPARSLRGKGNRGRPPGEWRRLMPEERRRLRVAKKGVAAFKAEAA